MKYILLPGFSNKNKDWAIGLKEGFAKDGMELSVIEWEHWKNGEENFDFKTNSQKVLDLIDSETDYIILAKSIGSKLLAGMLSKGLINPQKCILMGIPSEDEVYKLGLIKLDPLKVKVIQNTKDPYLDFNSTQEFIHSINPEIEVIETEGENHDYPYEELILELLK